MSTYTDFSFGFDKDNIDGVVVEVDSYSIQQSIRNILFTRRGEVPFDPLFGSGIHNLLFEKMNPITERLLKDEIETALQNHEPRVVINNIDIVPSYDNNYYEVDIEYTIVYLDTTGNVQINIELQGV